MLHPESVVVWTIDPLFATLDESDIYGIPALYRLLFPPICKFPTMCFRLAFPDSTTRDHISIQNTLAPRILLEISLHSILISLSSSTLFHCSLFLAPLFLSHVLAFLLQFFHLFLNMYLLLKIYIY